MRRFHLKMIRTSFFALIMMAAWGLPLHAAALYTVPDTGQTLCYNDTAEMTCPQPGEDFYGQDANYGGVQPSYADGGDGTVADTVTGLTWQKADDGTQRTWSDAQTYCDGLDLGGRQDWRMPSRRELLSIVDAGRSSPAVNPVFQCSEATDNYWTATVYAGDANNRWYVSAYQGDCMNTGVSETLRVRCVRGTALPDSVYSDNGDATVTDQTTGLMWEKAASSGPMTWKQALAYCQDRTTAGRTDWRLPNKREIEMLIDDTRYSPAMPPQLTEVGATYWASTTYVEGAASAWYMAALYGYSYADGKSYEGVSQYVRCVRDASGGSTPYSPAPHILLLDQ